MRQSGVKRKDRGCIKEAWRGCLVDCSTQFVSIRNLISAGINIKDQSIGVCWEQGLMGGLVDCFTQLMLGGGLVRKEAVK